MNKKRRPCKTYPKAFKLAALLDADVDVIDVESEDGTITVFTPHLEYNRVRQAILDRFGGIDFETNEI